MTNGEFKRVLCELKMTIRQFAAVSGLSQRLVYYYVSGQRQIPKYMPVLILGVKTIVEKKS